MAIDFDSMTSPDRLPPALVSVDIGNNVLEAICYYARTRGDKSRVSRLEVSVPHAFVELNEVGWKEAEASVRMNRSRKGSTHTFKLFNHEGRGKDRVDTSSYVSIGQGVMRSPMNRPLLGSNKYIKGGIDALLVALFCELFPVEKYPDGHDNIILSVGVPPTEWQQQEVVRKLLHRKHRIQLPDGTKRSFSVRLVVIYDESVGGITYATSMKTKRDNVFKSGQRVLVIDAGGRLGSMSWVTIDDDGNPNVDYDYGFKSIDGGSITIRNELRMSLKTLFPEELRGMRDIDMDDDWLDEIIRTKRIILSGDVRNALDASDAVNNSLQYLSLLRDVYRNDFGSGRQAAHILLTGGTTAQIFDEMCQELGHMSIIPAAPLEEIWYANVRGGMLILVDSLNYNNLLPIMFYDKFYRGE